MKVRLPGLLITLLLRASSAASARIAPFFIDRRKVLRRANLAYGARPDQRLDVYVPRGADGAGPSPGARLPVSILIHGGGFRYFSKDSHAAAAARLAESGRAVFCIDYRLTPRFAFPAGLVDAVEAYHWILAHAAEHGGDVARLSMIGESSGAGFIASMLLYFFGLRPSPAEASIPERPTIRPKAAILHCGYFEVSNVDRFGEDARFHAVARTRVSQIRALYLPARGAKRPDAAAAFALAEPYLAYAELAARGERLPEDFPEVFIPVGERDPVIGDSERMAKAFAGLGQADRLRVYPGAGHAFYASPFGKSAKAIWADIAGFLDRFGV